MDAKSPVPVSVDNVILDGAHRTAACLAYNKPITCEVKKAKAPDFSFTYFKNKIRYVPTGLEEQWADAIALELCKLKKNLHIATIFPVAKGKDAEIKTLLEKCGSIFYEKNVNLHHNGPTNFVKEAYNNHTWSKTLKA